MKALLELAPGVDFVDQITEAVSACDVLLAVIGTAAAEWRLAG